MKLSTRLTVLFITISILTVVGVGGAAYRNSQKSIEAKVFEDLTKTTILKEAELGRWLHNNEQLLEARAQRPLVKQYAAILTSYPPDSPEYQQAYEAITQDHFSLLLRTGGFLTVSILDPTNGQILISTEKPLEGYFRENEQFFIEGRKQTYTQTPAYALNEDGVVLYSSTPILGDNGELIAVLVGHLDLAEMSQIMAQGLELSASEETYLVNQFGFLVTDSRFEMSFPLQMTINSLGVDECLSGNNGVNSYNDYRGIAVLGSYRWLPGWQMCIVTEINQSEAFAPTRVLAWQTLWLALGVILITSAVSIFFSRSITHPLEELVIGTKQMAQGSLDHRVNIQRRDELGTLAGAFNLMAASLEKSQMELSVSERKYRMLIEGADAAISTVTHEGAFLFMNENAARQLGGEPSDFIGKTVFDLFPQSIAARQLQNIQIVIDEGNSTVIEAPSVVAGETRWYSTRLQPVQYSKTEMAAALVIAYDITSRKEAEQLLNEERDFVKAIMDTAQALIIVVDTSGRIVRFNWACEALTGFTFDEVRGQPFWEFLLLPDEQEAVTTTFAQIRAGDFPNTYENHWITKDGGQRAIAFANTCQLDAQGQVKYIIGTGIDITEQKEAEAALQQLNQTLEQRVTERTADLQESEKRFHRAITDAPFPIMMHAEDGEILHISDTWTEITGYALADIPTTYVWTKKAYGQEMAPVKSHIEQLYGSAEKVREGEYTITTKLGDRVVWDFSSSPLGQLKDGRRFVISMAMDVTARRKVMHELAESEARFRTAFDYAAIGRAIAAPEGRFIRVNKALCQMTGYTEAELLQKNWQEITHPVFLEASFDNMSRLNQGNIPSYNQELIVLDHKGSDVWIQLNVVLVCDADGHPLYYVGDIENITMRKQAELELKRTLNELERSNTDLQQFAYVASHDLQEPLRMVTSYMQLLQRRYGSQLDEDADEFIGYAVDGANRMKQLIQDLLSFSRVGTRGKPFEKIEAEAILQQALSNLRSRIEETNASITHDTLPVLTADSSQLVQLFQNLISNAIKFHSEDQPQIHIGVKPQEDMWQFSVRDNGIGFDPQFSDRIFVIFQRLHTRADYGGTGIGLAVCKKIIERHGGRIWADSQPGAGAAFYFTIPMDKQNDE